MNKILGVILLVAGMAAGYIGFNKVSESTEAVKILGMKFEASDESGKQQGYMYLGVAVILFAGGIYILKSVKK